MSMIRAKLMKLPSLPFKRKLKNKRRFNRPKKRRKEKEIKNWFRK